MDSAGKCYSTELYDKIHEVLFHVGTRDCRIPLNVKLTLDGVKNGFVDEKIVKIVVTDSSDPLLLLYSEISVGNYNRLKEKSGLLIDFSQFPQQLVSLLSLCSKEDDNMKPRFILSIESSGLNQGPEDNDTGIRLKITEVNQFQRLCLIALDLTKGSEREINLCMVHNIEQLKSQLNEMRSKVRAAEEDLARCAERLRIKCVELEKMDSSHREKVDQLQKEHRVELRRLEHDTDLIKMDYESKMKTMAKERDEKQKKCMDSVQSSLEKSKQEVLMLKNANCNLRSELGKSNEYVEKLHGSIQTLQDVLLKCEQKIAHSEKESKEKDSLVKILKQKISHMSGEADERTKTLQEISELVSACEKAKLEVQEKLDTTASVVEKQKLHISALAGDLTKANEIIAKVTAENGVLESKLAERSKVILKQEEIIKKMEACGKEVSEEMRKLRRFEEENNRLRFALEEKEGVLQQKEDTIRKNLRIISWLNDIVGKEKADEGSSTADNPKVASSFKQKPTTVPGNRVFIADGKVKNCKLPSKKTVSTRPT